MATITTEQVITEAKRLIDENPDFVYQRPGGPTSSSCMYVHVNGTTKVGGCIFGQALINVGISADELSQHEHRPAVTVLAELDIHVNPEQDVWISEVQESQDQGLLWAVAGRRGDAKVALVMYNEIIDVE